MMKSTEYQKPVLSAWGTIEAVTATGQTRPGGDMAWGSVVRNNPSCTNAQSAEPPPHCPRMD